MDINNLQRIPSYSYRVDTEKIKQRLQQKDKNRAADQRQSDRVDISEEGRNALREKMSAMGRLGQTGDIAKLSSISSYGIMNDFEKIVSELGNEEEEEGTKTDTFDRYANKMAAAYQLMKDRIEEKYGASDRQKEYFIAADGNPQEITKEKELEMLDHAYETHSRFMAASTQIWSELQDFKVQISYHSGNAEKETTATKNQDTGVREQAYKAFMSAISQENMGLLKQKTGNLNHIRLNLGISSSARNVLNNIWDHYANKKK